MLVHKMDDEQSNDCGHDESHDRIITTRELTYC